MLPRAEDRPFNGWGLFTFGMNFNDAFVAHPGVMWDPESFRKCRDEMPLRGCTLSPAKGSRVPLAAGVALLPNLIFNQDGKLAAIRLRELVRGDIEPAQCERAHGQLLDYLYETWGSPTSSSPATAGMPRRSTPEGREFFRGTSDDSVIGTETFNVQPDGRQIVLLSSYIGSTRLAPAVCHLSIYYRGPQSLQPPEERPHPLKNWE